MEICDMAISVISEYVSEVESILTKDNFEYLSYKKWAAYEIMDRLNSEAERLPPHISGRDEITPIDVIENFINDMDYFSVINDDRRSNFIFYVGRETGKEILYLFL